MNPQNALLSIIKYTITHEMLATSISHHHTPLTLHLDLRHLRVTILNLIPFNLTSHPIPIRLPQLLPKPTHLLPPPQRRRGRRPTPRILNRTTPLPPTRNLLKPTQ